MLISALFLSAHHPGGKDIPSLEIGAKAPLADRTMTNTSGKQVALKDVMNKNGLLVIFSCNTCPFVIGRQDSEGWQGRYNEVFALAAENGIGGILVNSNEAKRDNGDSMEDMKNQAADQGYKVNYVLDKDHILADAFGAKTTPHVFLFDREYNLVYRGAIDDNNTSATEVHQPWLKNALAHLARGEDIDPNATRAVGCSIKRVNK